MDEIVVLRYGHRPYRDLRVTSHCCLVARALGASKIVIEGFEDKNLEKTMGDIVRRWGGKFEVGFTDSWLKEVKKFKKKGFYITHLSMYGTPFNEAVESIRKNKKVAVIIGSQKVEIGVYQESDLNVSIGKQPHSEIGALAVYLDRLFEGKELDKKFSGARIELTEKDEKK